jgi:hypothetical protein
MLGQLGQRHLALDRGHASFALNAGAWCRRLLIVAPDSRDNLARRQADTYRLSRIPGPALQAGTKLPTEYRVAVLAIFDFRRAAFFFVLQLSRY